MQIPYGHRTLEFELPADWPVEQITAPTVPATADPLTEVERALMQPLGNGRLEDFMGVGSAAVAINDKTRPVPHAELLPPLLYRLEALGLEPESITLLIATGAHRPMSPDEFGQVLPPEILARYPVFSHDANDTANLVDLGRTQRDTPVLINRRFANADLRIVVGNIEPHQFQGYSGGVKSAAIGLAGKATIEHNHALMTAPGAQLGQYRDNPARQDVEQIGAKIGVHFALNAILNLEKRIVRVLAGDPRAVMNAGIPLAQSICQVTVPAPYDLVIASAGGHPKDINLYQAQKALHHASLVTRENGAIILLAACPEGSGSSSYENWMQGMASFEQVFRRFADEGFQVGPHKAWQIARDASRLHLVLVSEMQPDFVRHLLLTPAASLQEALDILKPVLPPRPRTGVMPYANVTIPVIANGKADQSAPDHTNRA